MYRVGRCCVQADKVSPGKRVKFVAVISHAEFDQWVAVPLARVFLFFANPSNLPRIMPPWMQVHLERVQIIAPPEIHTQVDGDLLAGVGSELEASYRTVPGLPFRIRSVARITYFAMNQRFEDIQAKGPFRSWRHCHEFQSEIRNGVSGTLVSDVIDFDAGFGLVGSVAQKFLILPQLKRTFGYRQKVLAELLT